MNGYKGHYLAKNRDTGKPTHHVFFDVETKGVPLDDKRTQHKLILGWALFWRRRPEREQDTLVWQYFETINTFWNFVEQHTDPKHVLYLISHNVSFDLGVLDGFTQLQQRGWRLVSLYSKGMTTIIRYVKGKTKIVILDNGNYFKSSLAALGKAVGLDKLEIDFATCSHDELMTYCKRDVEIMHKAWVTWYDFCTRHNLGKWGYTLPGQAMNAFRHRFMKHKLLVHKDPETLELEREAYRGGRTTAFYVGELDKDNYYKLDINSAYPWAMKQHRIPIRHLFTTSRASLGELREWLKTACVIAKVEVDTDDTVYPVHYQGHNVYPVGKFVTTLSTPELEYGLSKGWIKRVIKAAVYEWAYAFDEYVDFFYDLKQKYATEGNTPFYHLTKLFLNSLYGKFGQKASKFVEYGKADSVIDQSMTIVDAKTGKNVELYRFGDTLWFERELGESYNSIPAIAAHVTAYVRMYLYELRNLAGKDHVYYGDTDSFFVDSIGYERLKPYVDKTELGKLKVEGVTNHLVIRVPKNYCFGDKWTRKGIPYHAQQVAPDTWEFDKFYSIRGLAKQPKDLGYFTERIRRKLNYVLYDGVVGVDGWVIPFKAEDIKPRDNLRPEVAQRLWEIEIQIDALRQAKKLPHKVIFSLWDYKRGTFRKARDSFGRVAPAEYSKYDQVTTEYGFSNLDDLLSAVEAQVKIDDDIALLKSEHSRLLSRAESNPYLQYHDELDLPF